MQPPATKYQTVPTTDDGGDAIQSFELETPHIHNDSTPRRKYTYILTTISAILILVVIISYPAGQDDLKSEVEISPEQSAEVPVPKEVPSPIDQDHAVPASTVVEEVKPHNIEVKDAKAKEDITPPGQKVNVNPKMIFCYGDSLTYGLSPPSSVQYPYAKYLMGELNLLYNSDSASSKLQMPATIVGHLGLPGWTSSQMLDHINDKKAGICEIVQHNPTLSLMIILAGTNDLGRITNAEKSVARSVIESIVKLHQGAIECAGGDRNKEFRTLAVGVPGSAFQEKVHVASELAAYINDGLKNFATISKTYGTSTIGQVSYIEFPFPYKDGDSKWSPDGLHLSEEGYKELGRQLAIPVKMILDSIQ